MKVNVKSHPTLINVFVSDRGEVWEYFEGNPKSVSRLKNYPQCIRGNVHLDKYGYEIYTPRASTCDLNKINRRKKLKVHRLVANTWIENTNSLTIVNHINYNKVDNSVNNLEWVNLASNNAGKHRKVKNTIRSLRLACLRFLLIDDLSIKEVSLLTGVTTNTLSEAKRGDVWIQEWKEVQRLNYVDV